MRLTAMVMVRYTIHAAKLLGLLFALVLIAAYLVHHFDVRIQSDPVNRLETEPKSDEVKRTKIYPEYMPFERPFIGIALSGGGSRSANFSWAVLRELDELGLLEHAEAVSSVSGGSLAAAQLALNLNDKPDSAFWDNGFAAMKQDFQTELTWKILNPINFSRSIFSNYDRGVMWSEVLDDMLLGGKRFSDLPLGNVIQHPVSPGYRPSLYINATAVNDPVDRSKTLNPDPRLPMGDFMGNFTYTFERFAQMRSDLGSVPLSHAVAASSAFPGLINPLTLQLATRGTEYLPQGQKGDGSFAILRGTRIETREVLHSKRYVHLADGGLSDNLGTDTLRRVFETRMSVQRDENNKFTARPCLIISVDATSPPVDDPRDASLRRDGRGSWWSTFVDATAVSGYDAYLLRRRGDQLDELGVDTAGFDYGAWTKSRPNAVQDVTIRNRYSRYQEQGGYVAARSVFVRSQQLDGSVGALRNDLREFKCRIWHVALEDLATERRTSWRTANERATAQQNVARQLYLESFADAVLGLKTSLRLESSHSPYCSASDLQLMTKAAARELVHDSIARSSICSWMAEANLPTKKCSSDPPKRMTIETSCANRNSPNWRKFLSSESRRMAVEMIEVEKRAKAK